MRKDHEMLDATIARALQGRTARHTASAADVWPLVASRLAVAPRPETSAHRSRRRATKRQVGILAGVVLIVALAGVGGAAAAGIRLSGLVPSIGVSESGKITTMQPSASFTVLQPGYIPAGLTLSAVTHIPAHAAGARIWIPVAGSCPDSPTPQCPSMPAPPRSLITSTVETVWMEFAAPPPGTDYVKIVEQATKPGQQLPSGTAFSTSGGSGVVIQVGSDTTVVLVQSGTAVTIHTNLGPSEALKIARSLT